MTAPIFSGLILTRSTLGAYRDSSARGAARKADLPVWRHFRNHDRDFVTKIDDVLHAGDADRRIFRELGDVNEAILARQDFYKGAVRHDADDLTVVDLTALDAQLLGQAQDALDRSLGAT